VGGNNIIFHGKLLRELYFDEKHMSRKVEITGSNTTALFHKLENKVPCTKALMDSIMLYLDKVTFILHFLLYICLDTWVPTYKFVF